MKKTITIALALMLALALFTGCNQNEEPADEEPVGDGRTSLIVGFDQGFPPFGFLDENGEFTGFDLELAAEVCERRNWELVLQPINWDSKDAELESGTIDCIWNGFTINGREDKYTWTDAYMDNSIVYVVAVDAGIVTDADLADKVVAVQKATPALEVLEGEDYKSVRETFKELVQTDNYDTAFMDLEAGAVDAIAVDINVAEYQIAARGEDKYVMLAEPLSSEQFGVGFLLGNTELRDQIQETLLEMVADGTFAEISAKWFDGRDVGILGKEVPDDAAKDDANTGDSDANAEDKANN